MRERTAQTQRRALAGFGRIAAAAAIVAGSIVVAPAPTGDQAAGPVGAPTVPGRDATGPGTLAQFWNGEAEWTYVRKITAARLDDHQPFWDGAHIEVADGAWYLFGRRTFPATEPGCNEGSGVSYGLTVRASTDKGATWTAPADILVPSAGTPWACGVTDGDAYYSDGTWRYIAECWNSADPVVHGACYFERRDPSPLGSFAVPAGYPQPVVTAPELWDPICDTDADDCVRLAGAARRFTNAGTFKIVEKDANHFWVSMYGLDSAEPFTWYQGIAKTTDFRPGSWVTGGADGTPPDATLDPEDAAGWRESWWNGSSRGTGAADIAREGGQYYYLAEFIDVPPGRNRSGCQEGDHWNWGMFRSSSLASTAWEQFPGGNPVFYSSREREPGTTGPLGCNRGYASLFQDTDGAWYLTMGLTTFNREFAGVWLYRLDAGRNLLGNGDFWTAQTQPWRSYGPSLTTSRALLQSPDATPYGVLACGPACGPDAGIWQEVPVGDLAPGTALHLGGRAATRGGGTSALGVALWQYSPSDGWRTSGRQATREWTARTNWDTFGFTETLLPRTTKLRYTIYGRGANPHGWCLDGLYLSATPRAPVATPWPCRFADTEKNLVRNGDLAAWSGAAAEWTAIGATFQVATHQSHDGTPYGVLACDGPCSPDAGISQDITAMGWIPAGSTVQFGAKLATRGGGNSSVVLMLWQFNPSTNAWTPTSNVAPTVAVSGRWAHYNATATVLAGTTAVRLALYGDGSTPHGWCVDDLYLTTGMVNPVTSGNPCGAPLT